MVLSRQGNHWAEIFFSPFDMESSQNFQLTKEKTNGYFNILLSQPAVRFVRSMDVPRQLFSQTVDFVFAFDGNRYDEGQPVSIRNGPHRITPIPQQGEVYLTTSTAIYDEPTPDSRFSDQIWAGTELWSIIGRSGNFYWVQENYNDRRFYIPISSVNIHPSAPSTSLNLEEDLEDDAEDYMDSCTPERVSLVRLFRNQTGVYTAISNQFTQQQLHACYLALKQSQASQDLTIETDLLYEIGKLHTALQDYKQALETFQKIIEIRQKTGFQDGYEELRLLDFIASSYRNLKQYDRAIYFYQRELAALQKLGAKGTRVLRELGQTYYRAGNNARAMDYYQMELSVAPDSQLAPELAQILLNSGRLQEAEDLLLADIQTIEHSKRRLRQGLYRWGDPRQGFYYPLRSIEALEDNHDLRSYSLLQQVLVAQGKFEQALEISERSRAQSLICQILRKHFPAMADNLYNLDQIRTIAREHHATLVQYSVIPDERAPGDSNEMKPGAKLYIWVIHPTEGITFRQVDLDLHHQTYALSLATLIADSRHAIGARGRGFTFKEEVQVTSGVKSSPTDRMELRQLYQLLIAPIAEQLPQNPNDRVIFIPERELFQVPFPALQNPEGQYLIEQHTILTAPAIRLLALTQLQKQKLQQTTTQEALVVGNPTMPRLALFPEEPEQQLPPLPGTEIAAKVVAQLLGTQPLLGQQATLEVIRQRLPEARLIHLATHGFSYFFTNQEMRDSYPESALAFAALPQSTPGLLTEDEIKALRLKAELVVLSACDTGLGQLTSGEGVISLARSFIIAGAPTVLLSLWKGPDAPTTVLMTHFYENLQDNPDKAQALRQAMLATMKEYPDPGVWAAFTLIGEAD
ncbi:CHAT domain-containing tetratricopeptide repeat protein [Leptolyngbya sp. 'hensonii']|uniref:CHAT domain-containing protein n=1 Tax=Leptolyngbya sp. 'hensonii' TaxID=1922337 RepID=UPI0015C53012|nr:CHAT domain-containing tetratricopeptide repeat protein [Leptolyngbya sp. 'hensonii']